MKYLSGQELHGNKDFLTKKLMSIRYREQFSMQDVGKATRWIDFHNFY